MINLGLNDSTEKPQDEQILAGISGGVNIQLTDVNGISLNFIGGGVG